FIFASNVLAHVPEPVDFANGLAFLCGDKTTVIIEVPHALPMIRNNFFDVIFHQHYSYFNLNSLNLLFSNAGLTINKVEKISTQGGTLRLFISKDNKHYDSSVSEILIEEKLSGIYDV